MKTRNNKDECMEKCFRVVQESILGSLSANKLHDLPLITVQTLDAAERVACVQLPSFVFVWLNQPLLLTLRDAVILHFEVDLGNISPENVQFLKFYL